MAANISTLGQQISTITRIKEMQSSMSNAQLQISTGVKHQTYKEYGPDSLRIQRYRADLVGIEGYIYNIDTTQVNIEQMNSAVQESMDQSDNILAAIGVQLAKGSEFDLDSIKGAAKAALQIIEANVNSKVGDRYLFAGSDVSNKPYVSSNAGTSDMQARITSWLDGTTDTDTFLASINTITDSQAGFSSTLQSAKGVFARVDDSFEVDYTVKGNSQGFKDIINGLRAISNLEFPVDGVDQPTKDDFYNVLDTLYRKVQDGVNGLRKDAGQLAAAAQTLDTVKQSHTNDKANLQRVLENTEGADVTDAVIKLQTLQTQLDASYRATAILSQLSLARLLGG